MFRRVFVGVVALVLSVSVLAVSPVAVSPASAANTASENLINHDSNPATPQIRAFGGANRYATSVALAQAFRANSGSGGFVDTVIVASGESLVDAAAAAGLAASEVAPVLLTPPGRLQRAVENFIVDEFVSEVFIVGGLTSVSQAVEDAITALAPVRTVTRLAGANRYGTAVAVANEIGTPGVYCDTGQVAALLINVNSSFSDVIAAGPLAYSLELPILLTPANALPASVADYLTDAEIERVVIVGGTTAVSAAVVADVNEAGVEDVVRISGANRYDTALEIRQALSDCGTVTLSPTTAALVNAAAAADGVSAGPLLGLGLATNGATNGVTPVLLVTNDGLPADTRDFLQTLPTRNADASFVDVSLTAIGGAAVVSDTVVQAAIAAATTSPPITATITATAGADSFRVTFSSPVNVESDTTADGFVTSALNRVNYQVSGGPLVPGDTFVASNNNRTITIGLSGDEPLLQNAPISVVDGKIKGFGGDDRLVEGAQATARALAADRVRPRIEVFAPQGSHAIRIRVTEPNLATDVSSAGTAAARQALLASIRIGNARLYVADAATGEESVAEILPSSAQNDITVCLFGMSDVSGSEVCATTSSTTAVDSGNARIPANLGTGETITIAAGAFQDNQGNPSRSTTQRVTSYSDYPRVTRATVTSPVTLDIGTAAAPAPQVAQWRWQRYDSATPPVVDENVLTIAAKPDSASAGGAAGNDWRVIWVGPPATADPDTVAEVSVVVNKLRKTILINFDEDATIFSVVTALAADSEFAELFTVSSDVFADNDLANEKLVADAGDTDNDNLVENDADTTPCTDTPVADAQCNQPNTATPWTLSGGVSVAVVTLTYNETLSSFDYAGLVTANTDPANAANAAKYPTATRIATGTRVQQLVGWQADPFAADLDLDDEFRFLLTTASATFADLPKPGDTISLPAGLGETFAFVNNTPATDPLCPTGLSANSDSNPCGRSIAVTAPGQTLRRDSASGRIEGARAEIALDIPARILSWAGLRTIRITFDEAVNVVGPTDTANFPTSAFNLANYQLNGAALPASALSARSANRVVIITLPLGSEPADGDTISILGNQIAVASGSLRVAAIQHTVTPPPPITATIAATTGFSTIQIRFSEPVELISASSKDNYQIDGSPIPADYTLAYDNDTTTTITLPSGSSVAPGTVISVVGGQIKGFDFFDTRFVAAATLTTAGTAPTPITTTIGDATAGELTFTVTFAAGADSAAVNVAESTDTANFPTSARNPAHYQIDGNPLPGTPTFAPSVGNSVVTVTLPAGSELASGEVITVAGNAIKAAGATDGRRARAATHTVPLPRITSTIAAEFGERIFTVTFSEAVNVAESTDATNFMTSARNPDNYRIDPAGRSAAMLPAGTTFDFSTVNDPMDSQVATITLPVGMALGHNIVTPPASNFDVVVSVRGSEIKAANDDRTVRGHSLTLDRPITATITAERGQTEVIIEFSERINDSGSGGNFATSVRNSVNYEIISETDPPLTIVGIIVNNPEVTITVSRAIVDGDTFAVRDDAIQSGRLFGVVDERRSEPTGPVGSVPTITSNIRNLAGDPGSSVEAGSDGFTVYFSEAVSRASARNRANYRIEGVLFSDITPAPTLMLGPNNLVLTVSGLDPLTNGHIISVLSTIEARDDAREVVGNNCRVGTPGCGV